MAYYNSPYITVVCASCNKRITSYHRNADWAALCDQCTWRFERSDLAKNNSSYSMDRTWDTFEADLAATHRAIAQQVKLTLSTPPPYIPTDEDLEEPDLTPVMATGGVYGWVDPGKAKMRARERAATQPVHGPLTAREALDEARAVVESARSTVEDTRTAWTMWRAYQREQRRAARVMKLSFTGLGGCIIGAWWFGDHFSWGPVWCIITALVSLLFAIGGSFKVLVGSTRDYIRKTHAKNLVDGRPAAPENTVEDAVAEHSDCIAYLWDVENLVPQELVAPVIPDWNEIASAVEYDPEDDGYPRYSFELPEITDTPPAYENSVARVRERMQK